MKLKRKMMKKSLAVATSVILGATTIVPAATVGVSAKEELQQETITTISISYWWENPDGSFGDKIVEWSKETGGLVGQDQIDLIQENLIPGGFKLADENDRYVTFDYGKRNPISRQLVIDETQKETKLKYEFWCGDNTVESKEISLGYTSVTGDFSYDITDLIPEGYELADAADSSQILKYGQYNSVVIELKELPPVELTTNVKYTFYDGDYLVDEGVWTNTSTETGDFTFNVEELNLIPEGYALAEKEVAYRTGHYGNDTSFVFELVKLPPVELITTVNWTILGNDGYVLQGTYEFEPTTEVGDTTFNIDMIGGLPEGYALSEAEEGYRVVKIGSTEVVTFLVDKLPEEDKTTTVNYTFLGDDGYVLQGTWEKTTEAGIVGDFFFDVVEEGLLPEGYALAEGETSYRTVKYGETTAFTFELVKLPPVELITTVNWTILGNDGYVLQGTYEFEPTTEVGDTTFNIDMIGGLPEGYALSEGEEGYRVVKIGSTGAVTFLVDKLPEKELTTTVNYTFLGDDGYVLQGTWEKTTEAGIVGDFFFDVVEEGLLPEGYALAEGETSYRATHYGETTAYTFLVEKLPAQELTTTVNWTILGSDGFVLQGVWTKTTEAGLVGDFFFDIVEEGLLPEGYKLAADETSYRATHYGETTAYTFLVDKEWTEIGPSTPVDEDKEIPWTPIEPSTPVEKEDSVDWSELTPAEKVEEKEETETPDTSDNNMVAAYGLVAMLSAAIAVVLKKKEELLK